MKDRVSSLEEALHAVKDRFFSLEEALHSLAKIIQSKGPLLNPLPTIPEKMEIESKDLPQTFQEDPDQTSSEQVSAELENDPTMEKFEKLLTEFQKLTIEDRTQ